MAIEVDITRHVYEHIARCAMAARIAELDAEAAAGNLNAALACEKRDLCRTLLAQTIDEAGKLAPGGLRSLIEPVELYNNERQRALLHASELEAIARAIRVEWT